jgi:Tfp pilus assembly protein PilN
VAEFDLNLSTRPFSAYRLINIALAFLLVVLVVLSVWQAAGFLRYSRLANSIRAQEQETRVEAEALGKRVAELESRLDRPESTAKLNEIGFLNHLIQRKNLSWTRFFANLEDMVPDNVHLTTLTPDIAASGPITFHIGVRAKSIADVTVFLERLEQSPVFENVIVTAEQKNDANVASDVDVTLSAIYHPERDTR